MRDGALLSWPLWASVGIHVVGLATASSVIGLARHEPPRVLVPVEMVRVEPPPAPAEKPRMPRQVTQPSPVVRSTPTTPTLMQDPTPRIDRTPDPAAASPEIPGAPSGRTPVGTGVARGGGEGVTSLAHPLGGYQSIPHYPEAARREGVEGTVTLRFEVLASGKVGTVQVQRSAGRADMDRAAVEAIRTWLFEPARRGKEAVAVWVTLPVRFELNAR